MKNRNVLSGQRSLPYVVQIGFAGSRNLFEDPPPDRAAKTEWENALKDHLCLSLQEVRTKLELAEEAFFCGVSQIAIGADMVFARVMAELDEPHRIFLPQSIDDYLAATGSKNAADFTETDRVEAKQLLASKNIIEVKVVSDSPDRKERFRESNAEILRVSNFVICVLRHDSETKAGGSNEFVTRARAIGKPVLEIRVRVVDRRPEFQNKWHLECEPKFAKPRLPADLDVVALPQGTERIPGCDEFTKTLRQMTGLQSRRRQNHFVYLSFWIVAFHLLATLLAASALALHGSHSSPEIDEPAENFVAHDSENAETTNNAAEPGPSTPAGLPEVNRPQHDGAMTLWSLIIPLLLAAELVALLIGRMLHINLHSSKSVRQWANARVVAEMARSVQAVDKYYLSLRHLFQAQFPRRFLHLLQTLNVLHLRTSSSYRDFSWQESRDKYLLNRVDDQIDFYQEKLRKEEPLLGVYELMFKICTFAAIIATFAKLALLIANLSGYFETNTWQLLLGLIAIVMPAVAIAALSWSAGLDYQARVETFKETMQFLKRQRIIIATATSKNEYDQLVINTETVLLGETASWFVRRETTNV